METAPVRTDLWQVLAGRAVGTPLAPDDPDLWDDISTRLNVAKARPRLRNGIEAVAQTTVRGQPYVMLRSPDREASYARLAPEEWALAQEMDGSRSVAVLVGLLARTTGSLAPERVTRVVADLGANRMLDELPVNAFTGLRTMRAGSRRSRVGRRFLDAARGRRMVLGDVDHAVGLLYRFGGRFLFTRPAAVIAFLLALGGGGLFLRTWATGADSLLLQSGSYATGGLILLALNAFALLAHELGHALATKHAGRRVPAVGVLLYFGIPSAFVDTTDIWMASRKHRLIATAAGPASALTLAGIAQVAAFLSPELAPLAFKLSFAWYLNALFNLNPLMALDGYYLAMDALEINNLRARGITFLVGTVRTRRIGWAGLEREARYVAAYGAAAALWTVIFLCLSTRIWRDRVSGLVAGLWHQGIGSRLLVVAFLLGLFAPVIWGVAGAVTRRVRRARAARESTHGMARRLDALRSGRLGVLPAPVLARLAASAASRRASSGTLLMAAGVQPPVVFVITAGSVEGRRPGDPPATVRVRSAVGDVLGVGEVIAGRAMSLEWRAAGDVALLALPAADFRDTAGELLVPPGLDTAAAEAALDAAPALAGLTPYARAELMTRMVCVEVPPGKAITITDPTHAVLVGAGLLVSEEGTERRGGEVLRASSEDAPLRMRTRTRATLWRLPGFAELGAGAFAAASVAPAVGAHGAGGHPPVTPPPSEVPAGDEEADDRLWRRTKVLLFLLLLLAGLSAGAALAAPIPWAEVRHDRVLLVVARGTAVAQVGTSVVPLGPGDRIALGASDLIRVGRRSTAKLVFAGGSAQVLCGGSRVTVQGVNRKRAGRRWTASGALLLERGALFADTSSRSSAFRPLALRVESAQFAVQALGARFGMTTRRIDLRSGLVSVQGIASRGVVDCRGDAEGEGADPSLAPFVPPSANPADPPTVAPSPRASVPVVVPTTPARTSAPGPAPSGVNSTAPPPAPSASPIRTPRPSLSLTPPPRPTATATPPPPQPTASATSPPPQPTASAGQPPPPRPSPTPTRVARA